MKIKTRRALKDVFTVVGVGIIGLFVGLAFAISYMQTF
jgi:hypothetical protein